MNIFILGPPGSGKGAQSEMLEKYFGFEHVSSGDLLRDEVCSGSERGKRLSEIMEAGGLVDDETIVSLIFDFLSSRPMTKVYVIDGCPRTLKQVFLFEKKGIIPSVIINLMIGEETLVERLVSRRVCCNCNCHAIYNILSDPPNEPGFCDKCGSPLVIRPDDREEVIRKRFAIYQESVGEILNFYRNSRHNYWCEVYDVLVTSKEETFFSIKRIFA